MSEGKASSFGWFQNSNGNLIYQFEHFTGSVEILKIPVKSATGKELYYRAGFDGYEAFFPSDGIAKMWCETMNEFLEPRAKKDMIAEVKKTLGVK